jgi:hypothetical protein
MTARPITAPVEGLTYQAFWSRFVRIVEPATGKIIKPIPTAKQVAFIAAVDSGQYHEYFKHGAKKTAKSFDAATWVAHHVFADPHYRGERLAAIASWDVDQSGVVFREIEHLIELDPWLSKVCKRYKEEIVFTERRTDPRTGSTFGLDHRIRRLPRDLKGTHGLPFTCIVRDELWTEPSHEYSESLIITPACPTGSILYTSYFPPHILMRRGSPFFDLLQRVQAGDASLHYTYIGGVGADAPWVQCPWITKAWADRQERILESSPSRFNRIILNIPGGADDGLITGAELRDALAAISEPASGTDGTYWCAVDLGVRHDWTGIMIGHIDGDAKLVIDVIRAWRPTPDKAVSLMDVAEELRALYQRFPWVDLRLDQSQSRLIVEMLQREDIPARVVEINSGDQNRLVTSLKAAFARRLVRIPDTASDLIEQLESVRAIETRRGLLKLQEGDGAASGDARAHDDLVFCLGLLVDMAGGALGRATLPEMSSCYRAESIGAYVPCYLWSGSYLPSGDASCRSCPGHAHVLTVWRQDSKGLDLRAYRKLFVGDNALTRQRREQRAYQEIQDIADALGI